jgi:TetR/AcrR family transcriptional regulator, mexJK operon transcriptional repressor
MNVQTQAGRPKDLEKRKRILESAKKVFLELGYHGSSMNHIAQNAGVTKLTIYNHFQDKETLFTCAIEDSCESTINAHFQYLDAHSDFKKAFYDACYLAMNVVNLPEAIKLEYLLIELASQKNPSAFKFYQASHEKFCLIWQGFFTQAAEFKFIRSAPPEKQTELIMSLLFGMRHQEVLLGVLAPPTTLEMQNIIDEAMQIFFLKYGI